MTGDTKGLPAALGFTAADLKANRKGKLSHTQIERLINIRRRKTLAAAALFAALVLAATILVYIGQVNRSLILFGAGAMLTVINAIGVGRAGRAYMRVGGDLRSGRVEALVGDVERVMRRGPAHDNYLLRINGAELTVTKDVFIGFRHEAPYRLYRTSFSRLLLSAEPAS